MSVMKFVFLLWGASLASGFSATPVGKVVEMLQDMKSEGEKAKKDEKVQFAAYKQFCETTEAQKVRVIQDAKDKVEVLTAQVEKGESDASKLAEEIAEHTKDLESASAEKEALVAARSKEREAFDSMLQDYVESIEAIGRALKELKANTAKNEEGALVQLSALKLPDKASRGLQVLMADNFEDKLLSFLGEETGSVATRQSGGIVDMLEKLEEKFMDERLEIEKEETAKRHAHELLAQSLTRKAEEAGKEKQQKETLKAKKLQEKASAAGDLSETEAGLKTDEEYLAELTTTCKKKAGDFEDRQKLRDEELVAIGEAAKAISEITSSSLVQMKAKQASKSTVLAQLRSEVLSPVQAQVARFLQREATQINSRVLSALAERALADPMGKVKKMIEQLITRLEEQGQAETTKKAWCDSEISTNKQTREEKSDAVSTLQAEMDKLQAELEKLDEDTTGLASELTELEAAVSQATELRAKEKEKNEANLKEAKAGQEAVAKAILVLKEFYAKASKPSLLATSRTSTSRLRDAPEVFGDEAYQGMKNTKSGVISMLEVIEGDFSRLEAETTIGEAAAAKEHETFVEESKLTKVEKSKEAEHKKSRKQEKSSELLSLKADLRGTEKELEAAESYYEKLKPDCLNDGMSAAERIAQREQEMKDLKEALEMLSAAV